MHEMRIGRYLCVLFGLLSWFQAAASARGEVAGPASRRPPNVILILADDLGSAELGCYGQKKIRTPRIDRMAAEGLRFTRFYAGSPVCAPSRCTLLTGKHGGHAYTPQEFGLSPGPIRERFSDYLSAFPVAGPT